MIEEIRQNYPEAYLAIDEATKDAGFTMASATMTCSLLQTLAASKPGGNFLELGTGTGLSTAWILEGMDQQANLTSIDNDAQFLSIAERFLGQDSRLKLECIEGEDWVLQNKGQQYDYIFADTWHGKYLMLDEVLDMLKPGAFYIIDDMLPQENWPEGHAEKAIRLIEVLEQRDDLVLTKQCWATGIVIATKKTP
ncbi:O-methyltransferase [Pedobacter gandavensis]|uniref:O-methyltransferase n=1 Tax=Pedobacter gandavensis TaxID=2679963 RepID=UPI00292EDCAC|nr:class I SAM-dependent methyltransferase [Pedobacter gandavensis]